MITEYKLTETGKKKVTLFLQEIEAKRKEILDSGIDTADETTMPTEEDILCDIELMGIDDAGEYYNGWGVTDHYDSDAPISLKIGEDFVEDHPIADVMEIARKVKNGEKDLTRSEALELVNFLIDQMDAEDWPNL